MDSMYNLILEYNFDIESTCDFYGLKDYCCIQKSLRVELLLRLFLSCIYSNNITLRFEKTIVNQDLQKHISGNGCFQPFAYDLPISFKLSFEVFSQMCNLNSHVTAYFSFHLNST